ncbi:probable aminopeptidase NPEPL1 [Ostrea edulis]|uniref:probable aminopeptidase NPEPL1 n=1 Tax=Ostrea edulis TaxID=37623 RepID=UPI00209578D2|nr:probable aminopeptidase NPEPL1 [Ostrea edulis]
MPVKLVFGGKLTQSDPKDFPVVIIGQLPHITSITFDDVKTKLAPRVDKETFDQGVGSLSSSPTSSCPLWLRNATIAALPVKCSRHNAPSRAHSLSKLVKTFLLGQEEFVVIVCERKDAYALGCSVARVLPLFSGKSGQSAEDHMLTVEFLLVGEDKGKPLTKDDLHAMSASAHGIRLAAEIVDKPCSHMNTDHFVKEAEIIAGELKITPFIVRGEDLKEKGFGGIYNVGRSAEHPPALVVLSHKPEGATKNIAWVGKGIVFDTGGLCIKTRQGMCGMKRDCGGAAGILGAFYAAVKLGFSENLHAVFCLAENAVGPLATRTDDVYTHYSGRTVEVNNTDAEGRLVLADGVAYARKDLKADVVVDMATLTGAQGIATGKYHGSIVTNDENMELWCVKAGQNSADLVHPMPYSPELHFPEFNSAIADAKNSVADRSNAQVSCAGLYIASNLGFDYSGVWLHIDMAAPVHSGERATGYGVALLATLFGQMSHNSLLKYIAPPVSIQEAMEVENEDSAKKIRRH